MPSGYPGRLSVVDEGRALVYIPDPGEAVAPHGLEPSWMPVFYNPVMEYNRDVSLLVIDEYLDSHRPRAGEIVIAEPLAATGVRCVRYSLELGASVRVVCSDIDPLAARLIRLNVELNGVGGRVDLFNEDANALLHRIRREAPPIVIDIDPYGSPSPFLDSALRVIPNRGLLAVTATDLAVLEGSKERPALRKYMARIARNPQGKETAVRVLLGYMARIAAGKDKFIRPLLSYYLDHYVRVFVSVGRGARAADRMLERDLGYLLYCHKSGYSELVAEGSRGGCPMGEEPRVLGPLWVGELVEESFVANLIERLEGRFRYLRGYGRIWKLLRAVREEAPLQRYVHQRIDFISRALRVNVPKRERVIKAVEEMGGRATRTHFHPVGFRADLGGPQILEAVARAVRQGKAPAQN